MFIYKTLTFAESGCPKATGLHYKEEDGEFIVAVRDHRYQEPQGGWKATERKYVARAAERDSVT